MWLKVYQTLKEHHKLTDAADDLAVEPVLLMGMLVSFWLWAMDNAPDGNLGKIKPGSIARAAQWDGDPTVFIAALKDNEWLDQNDDGTLSIHNWDEYGGKIVKDNEKDKSRKNSRKPSGNPPEIQEDSEEVPPEILESSVGNPEEFRDVSDGIPPEIHRNSEENPSLDKDKELDKDIELNTTTPLPPPEGEVVKSRSSPTDSVPYQKIMALYNEICGATLGAIKGINGRRRKAVDGRWKDLGKDIAKFEALFRAVMANPFLRGEEKDWHADFDWLMVAGNMDKVLEDKYFRNGRNGRNKNAGKFDGIDPGTVF